MLKKAVGRPPSMAEPREAIMAGAARLFAAQGYDATSLRNIAEEIGLSKAAVYHYFPTKQVIFEAIVTDLLKRLTHHVAEAVAGADTATARLRAAMMAQADFFERNYTEYVTVLHGFGGLNRRVGSAEVEIRDRHEALFRRILIDGDAAGEFAVADPAFETRAILSMLNWMARWYKPNGPLSAAAVGQRFFELIFEGIRSRSSTGKKHRRPKFRNRAPTARRRREN